MGNVEIVDKGAPLGIVGTVRANEPNQLRAVDANLDELITGGMIEPLAPHMQPFLGQISVKKLIVEGTPIVLTPATRVEIRDGLRVGRFC